MKLKDPASIEAPQASFHHIPSKSNFQQKMEEAEKEILETFRRGEGRHRPLGNKPWKKERHHQECALDKKLEEVALMEEKKERREEHEIEGPH